MKSADALTTTLVAIGTMTAALALIWPASLTGGDDKPDTRAIRQPQLEIDGDIVKLVSAKPQFESGQDVVLLLKATNSSSRRVQIKPEVLLTDRSPISGMDRTGPMDRKVFEESYTLTLDPGEEATVRVDSGRIASAGHTYSFVLEAGQQKLLAGSFTAAGVVPDSLLGPPTTQPARAGLEARSAPAPAVAAR
jgi:hypothetical protein